MSVTEEGPAAVATDHGLVVALGRFAQQIDLIDALHRVPFKMKTVTHSPGDKLTELFVHPLAGGMHVQELEVSPHPLVRDQAVAQAWEQQAFASASGVSDLLRATTPETVAALQAELRHVTEPYRRRVLREAAGGLVVDFDLTGLVVSDQATTYEGADYGYMGEVGGVAKGEQFARAQLAGPRDPLLLGGFLHAGRTISAHCLRELVALVERELGAPRRRVEAVAQRLAAAEHALAAVAAQVAASVARAHPRPHPRLDARHQRLQEQVEQLRARQDALAAEHAANPLPRRILLRLDGGFGDAALVAWLYEQGYDFVARAHSQRVAAGLQPETGLTWDKVSKNGSIAEAGRTGLGDCPYPLRLFACRQWRGEDKPERWSALVANPELTPKAWPARRVGVFYNARQVAEASIKEGKGILASRHLPTRHQAGIALYQELVLLAQNFLHWFRRHCLAHTPLAAAGTKALVRLGAHSPALLVQAAGSRVLQFTTGPWQGVRLALRRALSYQLWFPFLEDPSLVTLRP